MTADGVSRRGSQGFVFSPLRVDSHQLPISCFVDFSSSPNDIEKDNRRDKDLSTYCRLYEYLLRDLPSTPTHGLVIWLYTRP